MAIDNSATKNMSVVQNHFNDTSICTRSATAFLRWLLEEGRAGQAALDAGLIPVMEGELQAETALERELLRLQAEQDVHLYEPGGDYLRNRRDFELVLRAMINGFL